MRNSKIHCKLFIVLLLNTIYPFSSYFLLCTVYIVPVDNDAGTGVRVVHPCYSLVVLLRLMRMRMLLTVASCWKIIWRKEERIRYEVISTFFIFPALLSRFRTKERGPRNDTRLSTSTTCSRWSLFYISTLFVVRLELVTSSLASG